MIMLFEYYNNYLRVTNYRQLKQLETDKIIVDNLEIIGSNLVILSIDKEQIIINGNILTVKIGWTKWTIKLRWKRMIFSK